MFSRSRIVGSPKGPGGNHCLWQRWGMCCLTQFERARNMDSLCPFTCGCSLANCAARSSERWAQRQVMGERCCRFRTRKQSGTSSSRDGHPGTECGRSTCCTGGWRRTMSVLEDERGHVAFYERYWHAKPSGKLDDFSRKWPALRNLIPRDPGSVILDYGCGNG